MDASDRPYSWATSFVTAVRSKRYVLGFAGIVTILLIMFRTAVRVSDPTGDADAMPPVDACTVTTPAGSPSSTWRLVVRGETRLFKIIRPASAEPGRKYPVVFFYHGAGGTADDVLQGPYKSKLKDDVVFVAPIGHQLAAGVGWDEDCAGSDMALFDRILDVLPRLTCVDHKSIVAAGFSWGGDFANDLGCCRGNRLSGIVSFSGAEMGNDGGSAIDLAKCTAKTPPYLLVYGGKDTAYAAGAFQDVLNNFIQLGRCATNVTTSGPCRTYQGCKTPVMACLLPTMAHEISNRAVAVADPFVRRALRLSPPRQ